MNAKNRKRLLKDVLDIMKNPLDGNGIVISTTIKYVKKGYAMIIGPANTIYNYGFYFLNLNILKNILLFHPRLFIIQIIMMFVCIQTYIGMEKFVFHY